MALTNFFNINLPYWMRKVDSKWEVYNREYKILWWNDYNWWYDYPLELKTEYARLTDNFIEKNIPNHLIHKNEKTWKIVSFNFYSDWTNPWYNIEHWDSYSKILKAFIKIMKK